MYREHNKIVRDRIPEILASKGIPYKIEEVPDEEINSALLNKLREEVEELANASNFDEILEEFADIYEVLEKLQRNQGISEVSLRTFKGEKKINKGGFESGVRLLWTN